MIMNDQYIMNNISAKLEHIPSIYSHHSCGIDDSGITKIAFNIAENICWQIPSIMIQCNDLIEDIYIKIFDNYDIILKSFDLYIDVSPIVVSGSMIKYFNHKNNKHPAIVNNSIIIPFPWFDIFEYHCIGHFHRHNSCKLHLYIAKYVNICGHILDIACVNVCIDKKMLPPDDFEHVKHYNAAIHNVSMPLNIYTNDIATKQYNGYYESKTILNTKMINMIMIDTKRIIQPNQCVKITIIDDQFTYSSFDCIGGRFIMIPVKLYRTMFPPESCDNILNLSTKCSVLRISIEIINDDNHYDIMELYLREDGNITFQNGYTYMEILYDVIMGNFACVGYINSPITIPAEDSDDIIYSIEI